MSKSREDFELIDLGAITEETHGVANQPYADLALQTQKTIGMSAD